MIKKITLTLLILVLALSTACSKKEEESESRTVSYDELGLTYTTPDAWREFEETNIYPSAYSMDGIFAVIDYSYVTADDYEKYLTREIDSLNGYLFSICKIVVIEEANTEHENVDLVFSNYDTIEKAASQKGYDYYVLYDNNEANFLKGDDYENYEKITNAVPELVESVSVYDFDSTLLEAKTEEAGKMLTFITKTLEGEDINSSVFGEYDLTLFNIWGTNAYPQIDEHKVLQEVYEWIKNENLNVNIIMAVTDTPSPENEAVALQAKADAGAEFTSIMLDETLAKWVTNNISGVPTTVLVNNEAIIISDKIEGKQDAETYKNYISLALEELNK